MASFAHLLDEEMMLRQHPERGLGRAKTWLDADQHPYGPSYSSMLLRSPDWKDEVARWSP